MLFYYIYYAKYICWGVLGISFLAASCAGYAYAVNAQRAEDDPDKKDYGPGLVVLAFFTWPVLLPLVISLFLLRVALYSLFIIVFAVFLLILPRQRPEPTWAETRVIKLGNALLKANSFLIKLMLRPWAQELLTPP